MNDTDKINGGYVVFARAAMDSQLWQCGPDVLRLSMYLLLQARFNPVPKKYPGFVVSRGDVLTSLSTISEDCSWFENRMIRKWSRGKVSRLLAVLSKIGFCRTISDTYGTHLNICKYELYQDLTKYKSDSDGTTPNSDGHETERPRTSMDHNSKNVQEGCKNVKKEKNIAQTSAKRFTPPSQEDVKNYCLERNNGVDPNKWFNFYEAKGWMVGRNKMKDWKAAVRTWEDGTSQTKPKNTITGQNGVQYEFQ